MASKKNETIADGLGILRATNRTTEAGTKTQFVEVSTELLREYGIDVFTDHQTEPPVLRFRPTPARIFEGESIVPADDVKYELQSEILSTEDSRERVECLTCKKNGVYHNRITGRYDCLECGQSLNYLEMVAIRLLRQHPIGGFKTTSTGKVRQISNGGKNFIVHIGNDGVIQGFEI